MSRICKSRLVASILILAWVGLTLALTWPALARRIDNTPRPNPPQPGGADYLIVAPEALSHSARAWADYRRERGCAAQTLLLSPEAATIEQIRESIQQTYLASGRPFPFYVLLLGHAHPASSSPASYLPAARLEVEPEYAALLGYDHIASDSAYATQDDPLSSLLPIAIGRIPARSDEEALRLLDRTHSYEAHPPSGVGRTQVELIASSSKFGPTFDRLIEWLVTFMVEERLPADYRWHMLYGNPDSAYAYPVAEFPQEVARRLERGAHLVAYIGHGDSDSVGPALSLEGAKGRIFSLDDLPLAQDVSASLLMMIACSAGEYDAPGEAPALAEALLLHPGGAAATYAASRLTVPAANTVLGKDLFQVLLARRAPTAGEWIWRAESNFRNPGADRALSVWLLARAVPALYTRTIEVEEEWPRLEVQTLYLAQQHAYNLFGDPALALAHPKPALDIGPRLPWQPFGGSVTFTGSGSPPGQTVTVDLEALPGANLSSGAAPSSVISRYVQANYKTVGRVSLRADAAGEFAGRIQLPPKLPSGRYLLRAVTLEEDATLIGTGDVYIGWPPIGEILTSTTFWWLLVSATLLWKLIQPRWRRMLPLGP